MKKHISVLLVLLIAISMLPVRVMATDETTNSTANETGYSLNMPFYLTDQEARCFIGFLFNTKELTEEQLTDGNIYAFLTGQLSGDAEIESGFIFRDTMNAQLSRVVSKFEYASEQGREWMLDYLYLKAENTPGLAEEIINDTLHSIASRGLDYILDEYTIHGGPLEKMEYEYIQDGKLIKSIYDKVSGFPEKVDEYKKMVLALSGAAFYAGGTNRLEMYNYFLDMKSNMVYKYKYGQEYYDIVMSQYQYDEHYVVMRKIQPILANWEFLDQKMLLWATDERIALIDKWAEFAYLLDEGLAQFPEHKFGYEDDTTPVTDPTSTEPPATEPSTQPSTDPPLIDETYYGITSNCMWELKTLTGVLTIMGNGKMASYSSASSYPWYNYRGYVKQLIIKNGVTNIGSYAFYGCSGLTGTIEVPKSVKSIGDYAFYGTNPEKMILPFIGNQRGGDTDAYYNSMYYIFSGSSSSRAVPTTLTEVEITDETVVAPYAFGYCTNVTKIKLNEGITKICDNAFSGRSNITELNIPSTVASIGKYAFSSCSGLTSIVIPDGVKAIDTETFYNCKGLTSITIPNSVTTIGSSAFKYCSGLTSIAIPEGVTAIGSSAFYGCSSVDFNDLKIPDGVTNLGSYTFYGCSGLTGTIEVPKSVKSIGDYAFYGTNPEKMILPFIGNQRGGDTDAYYNSMYYIFSGSSSSRAVPTTLTEVEITDETVVAPYAFGYCTNVTKIKLNAGITKICDNAFSGRSNITELNIPSTVASIGKYAFSSCSGLTSIVIPDGVKAIDTETFYNCKGLTSITIPNSVTTIGSSAFRGCSGLTGIAIPEGVTSIGSYAFYGCSGLTGATILDSVTSIGSYAFGYYESNSKVNGFTISGYEDTAAQTYANNNGFKFISIAILAGDVDRDGEVTLKDAINIQKLTLSLTELTGILLIYADFDGNGKVDLRDALLSQRLALKLTA